MLKKKSEVSRQNKKLNGKLMDKVALVTGASSGIGEATALALAAQGAKVTLVARREERLKMLNNTIVAQCQMLIFI